MQDRVKAKLPWPPGRLLELMMGCYSYGGRFKGRNNGDPGKGGANARQARHFLHDAMGYGA
jgi:hypothetical protein